ncbi:MAG: LytTR family DNA-binding domain-containing protein [Balneolia bacterium]|nr:LytTR family DNA-binding domain-containing protein [Balneolia bacterium]
MYKVIIIDDESAGRKLIKEYIQAHPDYVVLAEANNGVDAVRLINGYKPDLVFLDIQMPGLTGFEVLTHLEEIPQIIFSTAYDEFALQAFEVHAVDYLLKPYTKERFERALDRSFKRNRIDAIRPLTESLLTKDKAYPEKILVKSRNKLITVATSDIIRIEAYGDYSRLITSGETYLSNFGIGELEQKLDPGTFLRVHRSSIINYNRIAEVNKYPNSYEITMINSDKVRVSRGYMKALKKLMY